MAVLIQLRRDTAANWGSTTVLASGEVGYETDTGNIKIGNGSTQWQNLAYYQLPNVSVNPATTADLNNAAYRVMGRYRLNSVTSGTTFTNAPSDLDAADADSYCAMIVTTHAYSALSTLTQQTLTQFSGSGTTLKQWVRMYDGTNWTEWTSTAHLSDSEVTTAKIAANAVTYAKLNSDVTNVFSPIGSITMFAGSSAPTGWLLCNGATVSQTTYAALYAVLGSIYGSNAGGNFTLPDLRGRTAVGVNTANYLTTLGATAGSADAVIVQHTHSHTLGTSGDGAHRHFAFSNDLYSAAGASNLSSTNYCSKQRNTSGDASVNYYTGGVATDAAVGLTSQSSTHSHTITGSISNAGSAATNQNLQPSIALNYIIRAL
jgi:microcystin-dependent protein